MEQTLPSVAFDLDLDLLPTRSQVLSFRPEPALSEAEGNLLFAFRWRSASALRLSHHKMKQASAEPIRSEDCHPERSETLAKPTSRAVEGSLHRIRCQRLRREFPQKSCPRIPARVEQSVAFDLDLDLLPTRSQVLSFRPEPNPERSRRGQRSGRNLLVACSAATYVATAASAVQGAKRPHGTNTPVSCP
jgi:hypothetical protein